MLKARLHYRAIFEIQSFDTIDTTFEVSYQLQNRENYTKIWATMFNFYLLSQRNPSVLSHKSIS